MRRFTDRPGSAWTTRSLWPLLAVFFSLPAAAHVKWFSERADLRDVPLTLREILTPTFFGLAALSVIVIAALALLDDPLQRFGPYVRLREFLVRRAEHAHALMRVATGMSLLLSWSGDVLLAPDLAHDLVLVSWIQFVAVLCFIDRKTTPIGGGLVWLLYAIGIWRFGLFHMLDYGAFVGVGYYLVFHDHPADRARALVKPMLFGATGLSLVWLGLEKLVYPTWGLILLEQHPVLGMSLPPGFFLTSAAFVEISLGFLLLIGLLGRPLALVITLVFFMTTMVFGKHEVIGHLILHGILVVFMLEGTTGPMTPPFRLHQSRPLRVAFTSVNFALTLGVLLVAYTALARTRSVAPLGEHPDLSVTVPVDAAPSVALRAREEGGRWLLDLELERFSITPVAQRPDADAPSDTREGHAHLIVDGELKGMVFASPYELPILPPGPHTVKVQLSTSDHRTLLVDGAPVEASVEVTQR